MKRFDETSTCKTCMHWSHSYNDNGLGVCSAMFLLWACTEWRNIGGNCSRVLKDEHKDKMAFVQDKSDYSANLLTKPDFGCVMHAMHNNEVMP